MGYSFLDFMKRIGIFIICAQSFMHFAAGKSYEKYIKLLIGIMILAQFVVPVRAIFLEGENAEIWEEIEHFKIELENVTEEVQITGEEADTTVDMVETEIKEKLSATAAEYGCVVTQVRVSEEESKVIITVQKEEDSGKIKVDKVEITETDETYEEKVSDKNNLMDIKEKFGLVLGVDESYVEIRVK